MISKLEFLQEGWDLGEVSTQCQVFEGSPARIVLKKLVMMTTRDWDYCAGWEVEVVDGDLLRGVSKPKWPGTFKALPGILG